MTASFLKGTSVWSEPGSMHPYRHPDMPLRKTSAPNANVDNVARA
jgi:hypothetical protein